MPIDGIGDVFLEEPAFFSVGNPPVDINEGQVEAGLVFEVAIHKLSPQESPQSALGTLAEIGEQVGENKIGQVAAIPPLEGERLLSLNLKTRASFPARAMLAGVFIVDLRLVVDL